MADNIHGTFPITFTSGTIRTIDLPALDDQYENNSYGSTYNRNGITYIFDGSNSHDFELLQEPTDTYGITIPAGSYYVAGPWRRSSGAPRYLRSSNNDSVNLSVIKIAGSSTCIFTFTKV